MSKRVAIYLRVSTDEQTVENQRRELKAIAKRNGWKIVAEFKDEGISGAKGRDKRPGLDALLKGVTRKEFDVVAAWHVDRLGRSLVNLLAILQELHAKNIGLYLHQQAIDTTTPGGKALFQLLGVFAEFERSIIQERIKAGLARAREFGTESGLSIGRQWTPKVTEDKIVKLRKKGLSIHAIRLKLGVGTSLVQRVLSAEKLSVQP